MRPQQNPYVHLAVVLALVIAGAAVPSRALSTLLAVVAIAFSATAVALFVRQRRDPNGPRGQH